MKNKNKIDEIVNRVVEGLGHDVIIHRYNAFSTNSVYLKFDYGVANSLRISDHNGYDYLSYRFNIILGLKKPFVQSKRKFPKEFYPADQVDEVIQRIITNRKEKMDKYRDYNAIIERAKNQIDHSKSFWQCCKQIQ